MLDVREHEVVSSLALREGRAFYGEVVSLGAAAGEEDFFGRAADELGALPARGGDSLARGQAVMVLLEKRSHRLVHFGRKGGARKVVEIHAAFHWAKVAGEREVFNAGVGGFSETAVARVEKPPHLLRHTNLCLAPRVGFP